MDGMEWFHAIPQANSLIKQSIQTKFRNKLNVFSLISWIYLIELLILNLLLADWNPNGQRKKAIQSNTRNQLIKSWIEWNEAKKLASIQEIHRFLFSFSFWIWLLDDCFLLEFTSFNNNSFCFIIISFLNFQLTVIIFKTISISFKVWWNWFVFLSVISLIAAIAVGCWIESSQDGFGGVNWLVQSSTTNKQQLSGNSNVINQMEFDPSFIKPASITHQIHFMNHSLSLFCFFAVTHSIACWFTRNFIHFTSSGLQFSILRYFKLHQFWS